MDCRSVQDYLGDAIDRFLPRHVEQQFGTHIEVCKRCRNAYELEKLSKHIVQKSVRFVRTPPSVYAFVVSSLRQLYGEAETREAGWFAWLTEHRALVPSLAGGLAVVIFVLFLTLPGNRSEDRTAHTQSNDIINQSFKNFTLVRAGKLRPALVSSCPESVAGYFTQSNLPFAVDVIRVPDCAWYGAAASKYNGVNLAHVLYKIGEDWMYVAEVCQDDVIEGSKLSIAPAARAALEQAGWYTDPDHPDCNVVVWKVGRTVCTAVSTMKKEKLLALLTTR